MSEDPEEAQRRHTVMRAFVRAGAGTGFCPGCHQQKAIFSRRRATPGSTKERCLDCWSAER